MRSLSFPQLRSQESSNKNRSWTKNKISAPIEKYLKNFSWLWGGAKRFDIRIDKRIKKNLSEGF